MQSTQHMIASIALKRFVLLILVRRCLPVSCIRSSLLLCHRKAKRPPKGGLFCSGSNSSSCKVVGALFIDRSLDKACLHSGGEGGIRTLGTLLTYTRFPGVL